MRRAPYQALSAVLVMVLTFFLTTLVVLLASGFGSVLHYFEMQPQVTAFLKDDISDEELTSLRVSLEKNDIVKEVKYVSKDEALAIYKEENKNDPLLLEMVTANILPASFEISTTQISHLKDVADILKKNDKVEEVVFQEDVVTALKIWTSAVRKIGIGLVSYLMLLSVLVILVVIGMRVAARKDEIEIIRLLGATSWYVKAPFVFEGMFYGAVGAFIAWGAAYILLLYATPFLIKFLADVNLLPVSFLWMMALLGVQIFIGVLVGFFGSFLAVRRYLK